MIDYESSLRTHLLDDTAITDIVGTRMYPLFIPQGEPLPAIVWTIDGEDRSPRHYGGLVESFMDIELHLDAKLANNSGYTVTKDLEQAVRNRIDQFKGDLSNEFNVRGVFMEDKIKQYIPPSDGKGTGTIVVTLEFKIWFREVEAANCPI